MELVERFTCPVCGQRETPVVAALPFGSDPLRGYLRRTYGGRLDTAPLDGRSFVLRSCQQCGLVYQEFVPDRDYMAHLYGAASLADQDAAALDRGLSVRRNYANEVEQLLIHLGRPPSRVRVLDFGSGSGLWLQMAAAWGCRTAGVEFTEPGRNRVLQMGHQAYGLDDLPSAAFDFINAEQVLEHLSEPGAVVRRLAESLVPGGLLRINVPNGFDILERLAVSDWTAEKGSPRSLNPIAPLEHLNCFAPASLRRLGLGAGLEEFHYPTRQYLDPMVRLRFVASAVAHRFRRPNGTLQFFRRPG